LSTFFVTFLAHNFPVALAADAKEAKKMKKIKMKEAKKKDNERKEREKTGREHWTGRQWAAHNAACASGRNPFDAAGTPPYRTALTKKSSR